jgi:hypothetical protein
VSQPNDKGRDPEKLETLKEALRLRAEAGFAEERTVLKIWDCLTPSVVHASASAEVPPLPVSSSFFLDALDVIYPVDCYKGTGTPEDKHGVLCILKAEVCDGEEVFCLYRNVEQGPGAWSIDRPKRSQPPSTTIARPVSRPS